MERMKRESKLSSKQLKQIEVDLRGSDFLNAYFYRRISIPLLRFFLKTSITPNQITLLSLIFGVLSSFFFAFGKYQYSLIGGLLVQIAMVLDVLDGEVARLKKLFSKRGAWLDVISDVIKNNFIITGVTFGLFARTGNYLIWIYGSLALFAINMNCFVEFTKELFFRDLVIAKKDRIKTVARIFRIKPQYLILTGSFQFFLIGLGALFDRLLWTLWILVIVQNLYWILIAGYTFVSTKNQHG